MDLYKLYPYEVQENKYQNTVTVYRTILDKLKCKKLPLKKTLTLNFKVLR